MVRSVVCLTVDEKVCSKSLKVATLLQVMPPKDATCFLAPVSLVLVPGAQLQDHGQVWWMWYMAQPSWHVEQPVNPGIVGAVPLIAFVDIGNVGNVLEGCRCAWDILHGQVGLHWLPLNSVAHVNGCGIGRHSTGVQYTTRGIEGKGGIQQHRSRRPMAGHTGRNCVIHAGSWGNVVAVGVGIHACGDA
eukprot:6212227-Pleurochrysis_carterae.AAC.2